MGDASADKWASIPAAGAGDGHGCHPFGFPKTNLFANVRPRHATRSGRALVDLVVVSDRTPLCTHMYGLASAGEVDNRPLVLLSRRSMLVKRL
jgi:predicted ATPase